MDTLNLSEVSKRVYYAEYPETFRLHEKEGKAWKLDVGDFYPKIINIEGFTYELDECMQYPKNSWAIYKRIQLNIAV